LFLKYKNPNLNYIEKSLIHTLNALAFAAWDISPKRSVLFLIVSDKTADVGADFPPVLLFFKV
jgi:hypothetical protein